jgi:hypothetical protein
LAHKRQQDAFERYNATLQAAKIEDRDKLRQKWFKSQDAGERLQKAIHALGALQLGDIEDKDLS